MRFVHGDTVGDGLVTNRVTNYLKHYGIPIPNQSRTGWLREGITTWVIWAVANFSSGGCYPPMCTRAHRWLAQTACAVRRRAGPHPGTQPPGPPASKRGKRRRGQGGGGGRRKVLVKAIPGHSRDGPHGAKIGGWWGGLQVPHATPGWRHIPLLAVLHPCSMQACRTRSMAVRLAARKPKHKPKPNPNQTQTKPKPNQTQTKPKPNPKSTQWW